MQYFLIGPNGILFFEECVQPQPEWFLIILYTIWKGLKGQWTVADFTNWLHILKCSYGFVKLILRTDTCKIHTKPMRRAYGWHWEQRTMDEQWCENIKFIYLFYILHHNIRTFPHIYCRFFLLIERIFSSFIHWVW